MPQSLPSHVRASRVFRQVPGGAVDGMLEEATVRTLRRHEVLARQGDEGRHFYLVVDGYLKLVQLTSEGREIVVRFVGPGEPFGGVVALEDVRYPVTALATGPVRVLAWTREGLRRHIDAAPAIKTNLMQEMADHMNDALTRVRELATERVGQRLARTLLRLAHRPGRAESSALVIPHPLTQQELAEMAGTTLYTVNRVLSRWKAEGVLRAVPRGRISIVSRRKLEEAAAAGEAED
jgi:CRP/FNR family transcriptional regulator, nitrogen oxide reductase regulator